jgi:hypothetical protein
MSLARVGLLLSFVLVACSIEPSETTGESEQHATERCGFTGTMEPGTATDVARWTQGRDDWGQPASHHAGTGASGLGYTIDVRQGNAYATLVLTEGPRLRAGTYELSFKARTSRLDAQACASTGDQQWVEAGLKPGGFAREDINERRWFTRAIVDDFNASCNHFGSFAPRLSAELAPGGSLGIALKVGTSGAPISATFDDLALTCTGGACMACDGAQPTTPTNPTNPTPDGAGCEVRGAVRACAASVDVQQDFDVRLEGGRQRFATHERRPTKHEAVTISNDKGIALTFLKTAMGARLYSAKARGRELLYQNPTPRVQGNWGQGGFPVFGGVESAWPVEEHGYFGNLAWDGSVTWPAPGVVSFVARGTGASVDGSPATVTITTSLGQGRESWVQRVEIQGRPGAENMYFTNVMVDAGSKDRPADLEVIIPGITRAQVHSRGDADRWLPDAGGEFDWPMHAGHDVSHMNTAISSWLGMFVTNGTARSQRYGYFDHTKGQGLAVLAKDGVGFYPKFFCGRGITDDASGSGKAYCEMWFSPNARTFWDHPTLASATTVHEVRIAPFFDRAAFATLTP